MTACRLLPAIPPACSPPAMNRGARLMTRHLSLPLPFLALLLAAPSVAADLDRAPINYATAPADNPVSRLQQRIDKGQVKLAHDDKFGYLPALLKQLSVSPASQTLVFSKTSFQRDRIGPRTPRALYFSDDVYIGYCQHGTVLEVTAVDPQLGAVFYSLEQEQADKPRFIRQGDSCLICHGSSQNHGYPGHLIRSVYPDPA